MNTIPFAHGQTRIETRREKQEIHSWPAPFADECAARHAAPGNTQVVARCTRQRAFWEAYSDEMIARLAKSDLVARYPIAVDLDAASAFTPNDLKDWLGRILILEGDNDSIAEALKALHPQARVHTFRGTGHVASTAKLDEYVSVIKRFLHEN